MEAAGGKISFGFKNLKKSNLINNSRPKIEDNNAVELIECVEGQAIKIKDAVEEIKQPLIIPLKDTQKSLLDRLKDAKKLQLTRKNLEETVKPDSELTEQELVAKQLLQEAKDRLSNGNSVNISTLKIPLKNEEKVIFDGEKESTLDDYESVPISDYGLAILRGMGWKEGMNIGKNTNNKLNPTTIRAPELRPKGLGLGASKILAPQTEIAQDKEGNELKLINGGFAKILAGNQKGNYCQVLGFDEDAARVICKVFPKGETININEFMLMPVTKVEFNTGSKVLNNAKYDEYKEIADKKLIRVKMEQKDDSPELELLKEESIKRSKSKEKRNKEKNSDQDESDDDSYLNKQERRKKNKCKTRHKRSHQTTHKSSSKRS